MAVASPPVREIMSWMDLGDGARAIAEQVYASDWHPDIVLAIARGGLLPGGAVGYALGVKNTCTMNVEFYTDVDERLEVPMVLPPIPELVDLGASRMLIVDDVADTGHTLQGRQGVLRRQGRRHARRRPLREAGVGRQVRVRLAPYRPLGRLPVELAAAHRRRPRRAGRLTRRGPS